MNEEEEEPLVPKIAVCIDWKSRNRALQFQEISVYGSWNRFLTPATLQNQGGGTFAVELELPVGDHHYRFLVDDDWKTDDSKPKTVQYGEEYNMISVSADGDAADDDDDDDGQVGDGGTMLYDAVNQSFRIGKNKGDRRRRGRPSMEISLPSTYFTAQNNKLDPIEDGAEAAASGGRRRKKKKKKKKKNKGFPSDLGDGNLAAAFKQKEEEWARMCFVQQLKQQQQHNDEIQRVKTLWKQERQVRVEMHKKVVAAKSDLEKRLQITEEENERLKNNEEVNSSTNAKKLEQFRREKGDAEVDKGKLKERLNEAEEQLKTLRHEKHMSTQEQHKTEAAKQLELSHCRTELATTNAEITHLQKQLEASNETYKQLQEMHKNNQGIEQQRYENIQEQLKEEKQEKIELKKQVNDFQREIMNKERECQRFEDRNTTLENKLRQSEQEHELLKEKNEALRTNIRELEVAAQDTSKITEATEKIKAQLANEKAKLEAKIEGLRSMNEEQQQNYEEQIASSRQNYEEQITGLSEQNEASASAQISEINKRLSDKDDLINSTKQQLAKLEEQHRELQADFQSSQTSLNQSSVTEAQLTAKIESLTADLHNTREQLQTALDASTKQHSEASSAQIELQAKIQSLESDVNAAKQQTEAAEAKKNDLEAEVQEKEAAITQLQADVNDLQTKLGSMNESSSGFEAELVKAQKAYEAEKKRSDDMSVRVEDLEAEFTEREEELLEKLRETEEDMDNLTETANQRIQELENEREALGKERSERKQIFADVEARLAKMESEMRIAKESWEKERASLQTKLAVSDSREERIISSCNTMVQEFKLVRSTLDAIKNDKIQMIDTMNGFFPDIQQLLTRAFGFNQKLVSEVTEKYKREMSLRRKYFNQLQELRGNIRVFCRIRPLLPFELDQGFRDCITFPEEDQLLVHQADHKTNDIIEHFFQFDKVYAPGSTQEIACEDTTEYIQSVMDGYNVSIFAYGQTGSGKTFTMMGPEDNPGVNRRALSKLFEIATQRDGMYDYNISVAMFEIYNDKVRDLLVEKQDKSKKYAVRQSSDGSVFIPDLIEREVTNMEEVLTAMRTADSNRTSATTKMNEHSSRSHMLTSVFVRGFNKPANIEYRGRLYLVDLAGSERVGKSGATGQTLLEARHINKSLAALGDVMNALQTKQNFIPFRNSTLTYLMQNSLGGHAKTIMFINACPTNEHCSETLSSLKFAKRVSKVELGEAKQAAFGQDGGPAQSKKASGPVRKKKGKKKKAGKPRS